MKNRPIDWERVRRIAQQNAEYVERNSDTEGLNFVFQFEGVCIHNPFVSLCGRFAVEPVDYYGDAFLNSPFVKKES